MNLVFLDSLAWDYDVATPLAQPLGGSQSALCYLCAELARRGHRVTLLNHVAQAREVNGVVCRPLDAGLEDLARRPCDAWIVLNGPGQWGRILRDRVDPDALVVLWTQHAHDQPAAADLREAPVWQAWDVVACISDWQRGTYHEAFSIPLERISVLRNAISPAFENLFASADDLIVAKAGPPVLVYTSTPFRGLDVLLSLFHEVRWEHRDATLDVYSSMKVYQQDEANDPFRRLYECCRKLPGARHMGSVSQTELAAALRSASVLSYPNTFAETSCIAVMEAMAAGLYVLTSELGALGETTLGLGELVPIDGPFPQVGYFAGRYAERLNDVLRRRAGDPAGFAAARFEQVRRFNAECTWSCRARQWEEAVAGWRSGQGSRIGS